MTRLLLSIGLAACTPGTGFDDLPAATDSTSFIPDGRPTTWYPDTDADADIDADTDADTDTDTDTDTPPTGNTGGTGITAHTGTTATTGDTGTAPIAATIAEVQAGLHPEGAEVEVEGIVTALGTDGVYLQLAAGGPSSGVLVILGPGFAALWGPIDEGDELRVVGQIQEPGGTTTIDVVASAIPAVTGLGSTTVPAPHVTTAPALAADPEPWEGVLVELVDLVVADPILAGNEFEVGDLPATATFAVNDQLALYSGYAALVDGDRFQAIRGPISALNGRYRIEPRRDADLVPDALPDLRINEILADPPADFGDTNCDGLVDGQADDFVELWNVGADDADLTGLTLLDDSQIRHRFAVGTVLASGASITVFGGGSPTFDGSGTSGTWCIAPGLAAQTASSGALGLTNGGDTVTVASGSRVIESASFGAEVNGGQSITRDPDLSTNGLVLHGGVVGAVNLFSPGTLVSGVPAPYRASIVVDGDPTDFPGDSAFATSASTVSHVAWDASRLAVSLSHPSVALGADQWVVVYLGTGIGGTTTGFAIGPQEPALPFSASHAVRWAADDSASGLLVWDGLGWIETSGWLGTAGSEVADDDGLEAVEMSIPLAAFGATTRVDVVLTVVSDLLGAESTMAATPSTAIVNDTLDPDYTRYFQFHPNLDTPPSAYAPVP